MNEPQLELFDNMPVKTKGKTIDEAFIEFDEKNPHVYRNLVKLAWQCKYSGRNIIGIALLYEKLRWDYMIKTDGADYKLPNNYASRYARKIMSENKELQGIFKISALRPKKGHKYAE
jgi:hypothetical protein